MKLALEVHYVSDVSLHGESNKLRSCSFIQKTKLEAKIENFHQSYFKLFYLSVSEAHPKIYIVTCELYILN